MYQEKKQSVVIPLQSAKLFSHGLKFKTVKMNTTVEQLYLVKMDPIFVSLSYLHFNKHQNLPYHGP